jgi:hypothetical protein
VGLYTVKGRDHSEDIGVGGRIILKWILGKSGFGVWIGFIWFWIGNNNGMLLIQ